MMKKFISYLMPLTLIYSLPKTSTKGAMGHWAKKLNAEMYIQQHYPSLADILWKEKYKPNTTRMSSQKKTFRKEQGEIQSCSSGRKGSCYSFKSSIAPAWAQLKHVEKIYGILSWLAWGKEEVSLWGQAQEIIHFFPSVLQYAFSSTTNITVLLPTESWLAKAVLDEG